jgi:hypothetical protein
MKAVMVAERSVPVHQCEKYSMLVGWVVIRTIVEIEVNMDRFTLFLMDQRPSRSPVNICV